MIISHSQLEHEFCKSFIPLRAKRAAFAGHVCPDFSTSTKFFEFLHGRNFYPE